MNNKRKTGFGQHAVSVLCLIVAVASVVMSSCVASSKLEKAEEISRLQQNNVTQLQTEVLLIRNSYVELDGKHKLTENEVSVLSEENADLKSQMLRQQEIQDALMKGVTDIQGITQQILEEVSE